MELTRRDAVAALATLGVGGAAALGVRDWQRDDRGDVVDDELVRNTLVAAAEVVYPSGVSGTATFVETFLEGRLERDDHARGLRETTAEFNDVSEQWHGDEFPALSQADRDRMLREVGADTAEEVPDGTLAERVRYYVVNDLLLALYASPTGGELVGIENPQGHPGGIDTYQRGPEA